MGTGNHSRSEVRGRIAASVAAAFLVSTASSNAMGPTPVRPFSYEQVLAGPSQPDNSDAHLEIENCLTHWQPYEAARQKLLDAIIAAGFFRKPHSVLLEVGNAGWGSYRYAAVVNGHLVKIDRDREGGSSPSTRSAIHKLSRSMTDSAVSRMRTASRLTADGDCQFLTITLESGGYRQVVVYGPPTSAMFAGKTIETLLPLLQRVDLRLPSEENRGAK